MIEVIYIKKFGDKVMKISEDNFEWLLYKRQGFLDRKQKGAESMIEKEEKYNSSVRL